MGGPTMTMPLPLPPHQDPTSQTDDGKVSMLEYTTTLIAQLDRRFDTLHQDLKDSISDRFRGVEQQFTDADLRYQQRYDAQQIALKDALNSKDMAVAAALTAAEKAVTKAEIAAEKRFDAVNEFRGQLADQAGTFIPRAEAVALLGALAEKIDDLKAYQAAQRGRESSEPSVAQQIQVLVDKVDRNSAAIVASGGQQHGRQQSWGLLAGAIGLVGTLLAILVVVMNLLA